MQGVFGYLIAALLGVALIRAAWGDLRTRTIPNWLNIAIAAGAPFWWWSQDMSIWPDVPVQLVIAIAIFLIFAGCFAIGAMGGGDVKLIAALSLWLPFTPLVRMLFVMSILGGILTLATLAAHRLRGRRDNPEIPYGVAISCAGLWVFTNDLLTISGS